MGSTGKSTSGGMQTTTSATSNNVLSDYVDLDTMTHADRRAYITKLQQDMGQTGFEAGDPNAYPDDKVYVKTSKAFNINYYLNTDGKSIDSPNSRWQHLGYTVNDVKNAITQIDRGMKPITENVLAHRYVSAGSLGRMLGLQLDKASVNQLISQLKSNPSAVTNFNSVLANVKYTQKAYTSMSYRKGHSTFDAYPIRLNMKVKSGTPVIVTNNHAEHEILGARNLGYKFSNARVVSEYSQADGRNKDYLVIDVDF